MRIAVLHLAHRRSDVEWLARRREAFVPAALLAMLAVAVQAVLAVLVANVWYRMAVGAAALSAVAVTRVPVGWREVFRLAPRHIVQGVAAAVVLYAIGAGVAHLLAASPPLAAQMAELYGWKRAVPDRLALPLLLLIVLGEEVIWRAAVTLPLAARLGPWVGTLAGSAAYALAHLPMGVPLLLLAALGAGAFWSVLAIKTRSVVPALVSHLLFDLAVLFWLPYVRS